MCWDSKGRAKALRYRSDSYRSDSLIPNPKSLIPREQAFRPVRIDS
jgi:hypothetical protein